MLGFSLIWTMLSFVSMTLVASEVRCWASSSSTSAMTMLLFCDGNIRDYRFCSPGSLLPLPNSLEFLDSIEPLIVLWNLLKPSYSFSSLVFRQSNFDML